MSPELRHRLVMLLVVLGAGAVLGLAAWLEPSPAGHGTHTQLGLGQCSFLSFTGYPCPMCGMTTTFTLLAHGRVITAAITQPFGLVLFAMTGVSFGISAAELLQPRQRWQKLGRILGPYEARLASLFLVFMGLGWIYKIWRMNPEIFG